MRKQVAAANRAFGHRRMIGRNALVRMELIELACCVGQFIGTGGFLQQPSTEWNRQEYGHCRLGRQGVPEILSP